ncbi:acetyl-CoA carboxylase biotin carboxylase subunit family protein [Nocardiopsis sediminis]|uniref:Acetyl-CoA carboxylase biotin carboxylase subunit family protein n=1 Tax=Nocardiopsis sediminis TaxID=1778267 RepID=A0ABV8FDZ4_9ACTN
MRQTGEKGDNVFVLGLDEHNRAILDSLPRASDYRFHPLLDMDRLQGDTIDLPDLLDAARARLDAFDGTVDAIIGFWDFPVSTLVPILCSERGLPASSLRSVVTCEHKYWSRLEQAAVIDEVPAFAAIDFSARRPPNHLRYPLWLKPVKSFSSILAFRVTDDEQFRDALAQIREGSGRLGEPFEFVLDRVDLPEEVAAAGGSACLAEEEACGRQLTVEGYVWRGEPVVYGIVDSLTYPGTSCFLRYQYPSCVPQDVQEKLGDLSRRVIRRIGLDSVTFNIEYFWNDETGDIRLLEVNPRHSQSHARMLAHVDGAPNHEPLIRLALGREPELTHGAGEYAVAAKWFLRRFTDGIVRSVPTREDIARMEREIPGTTVKIAVKDGDHLSDLHGQDSYSYELAQVFVAGDDTEELRRTYERCVERLPFRIDDIPGDGEAECAQRTTH